MNSKLHAVCDGHARSVVLLLSEGQMSDYRGAARMLPLLPPAKEMLADKGYDAEWLREVLAKRGIHACIPLHVWSRRVVVHLGPVKGKMPYGSRSSWLSPYNAACSSRAPSVERGDPHPCRPVRPEPEE